MYVHSILILDHRHSVVMTSHHRFHYHHCRTLVWILFNVQFLTIHLSLKQRRRLWRIFNELATSVFPEQSASASIKICW